MERIWNKHKKTDTTLKPKVFVAMSGGVDSSVSAALLKKEGFDVRGVHLRITSPEWSGCTGGEDERDAARVAAILEIPFTTLEYTAVYKEKIVETMLAEYKAGRTPNPDVVCNREIKFGLLFDWAMSEGADFLATGHYARCELRTAHRTLLTARDTNKDQTYFLWTLTQEKLMRTLFPVGGYPKSEVRQLAREFNLPVAEKKDSQGLCFVGKLDIKAFLKKHLKPTPGDVLDEAGNIIGTHEGAALYTLGERHGFLVHARTPKQKPLFIVAKNLSSNTITVSTQKIPENFAKKKVGVVDCNWIGKEPETGKEYGARVRYRQPLQPCAITEVKPPLLYPRFNLGYKVSFITAQIAAPGQSLVIYDGDVCLGGGVITDEDDDSVSKKRQDENGVKKLGRPRGKPVFTVCTR